MFCRASTWRVKAARRTTMKVLLDVWHSKANGRKELKKFLSALKPALLVFLREAEAAAGEQRRERAQLIAESNMP